MDQYATCELEDAPLLAKKLKAGQSIIFSYSNDQTNAYVICITPPLQPVGAIPFGGNPARNYGVGVLRRGFFHFDFAGKETDWHYSYIGKKLFLQDDYGAQAVTEILNAIRAAL